ncbi:reverse transcriptase, partial [Aspergillus sclerotialis]
AIEHRIPGIRALSYADDLGIIAQDNSISGVCRQLERAAAAASDWGLTNGVQFDPEKTEAALFARSTGREFREKARRARVQVGTKAVV